MQKVQWGFLGNANIVNWEMLPAFEKTETAELAAIASRRGVPADIAPHARHYSSYEELLDDPQVQAVYVALPNALHCEWAIKAMEKGKHVLCEKPLAMNAAEAEKMFAAAEKNHVLLMEAFMYRFTEKTRLAEKLVAEGAVGEVRSISVHQGYTLNWDSPARQDPKLGGGSMYDVGCYCVNFAQIMMREEPVELGAGFSMRAAGYDDHACVWMRYKGGAMATLQSWFDAADHQWALVTGTKGSLEVRDFAERFEDKLILTTAEGRKEIPVSAGPMYAAEADAFSRAVLGEESFTVTKEETLAVMRTLDRIHALRP